MLYQVTFSPPQKRELKCEPEGKLEDIPVLTLAPFTRNPKIYFDGVGKGASALRKLQIVNPTKSDFEVTLIKHPTEDRKLSYSWIKNVIPAECSSELEITWKPIEAGGYCESIVLQYGNNLKKTISIICKCIAPKKKSRRTKLKKKTIRRIPTVRFKTQPDIANSNNPKTDFAVSTPSVIPFAKENANPVKLQDIHFTPIVKVKKRTSHIPLKSRFSITTSKRTESQFINQRLNEETFVVKRRRQISPWKVKSDDKKKRHCERKVKFVEKACVVKKNRTSKTKARFSEETFVVKKRRRGENPTDFNEEILVVAKKGLLQIQTSSFNSSPKKTKIDIEGRCKLNLNLNPTVGGTSKFKDLKDSEVLNETSYVKDLTDGRDLGYSRGQNQTSSFNSLAKKTKIVEGRPKLILNLNPTVGDTSKLKYLKESEVLNETSYVKDLTDRRGLNKIAYDTLHVKDFKDNEVLNETSNVKDLTDGKELNKSVCDILHVEVLNKIVNDTSHVKDLKDSEVLNKTVNDTPHVKELKKRRLFEKTCVVNRAKKKRVNDWKVSEDFVRERKIDQKHNNTTVTTMKTVNQNRKRCITNDAPIKSIPDLDSSLANVNLPKDRITFERNLEESRTSEEFFKGSLDLSNLTFKKSDFIEGQISGDVNEVTSNLNPNGSAIDVPSPVKQNSSSVSRVHDAILGSITFTVSSKTEECEDSFLKSHTLDAKQTIIEQSSDINEKLQENKITAGSSDFDQKLQILRNDRDVNLKVDYEYLTTKGNDKCENRKKRRSDLAERIFGKKIKPPINDLHNPDEYLASLNPEGSLVKRNWTHAEESCVKKEINRLLIPPQEPSAAIDKLLQKCKTKQLKNDSNAALQTLRNKATNLFRSSDVFKVMSKIINVVETKKLSIASDKNVHNSINLQQQILTLLLNYSPTWLRIGLETVFEETIAPKTKSDITSICEFVTSRLFKNPHLLKKYKSSSSPKYIVEIKKHVLRKILMLVYFLDYSKTCKIIPNDPCLFRRNAGLKESKDVLLIFSNRLLTPVRDVLKFLETIGYNVLHKQTFIHEFNYAVENVGEDLKDGVRLVKLLDVVLLKDSMGLLRVPAISRLQKVYNVKLALDMLTKAGCSFGDISHNDIVAGHRAKTLSLLMLILQLQNNCLGVVDDAGATL